MAEAKAEAQLKNANANLEQKNRELDEFVHTVSHDLKSPLVTIGGMLGLLKEELQEERLVAAGELIATAEETVVGMRDTIDDLLMLSRIGTLAIDLQPVGLRQVAEELDGRIEALLLQSPPEPGEDDRSRCHDDQPLGRRPQVPGLRRVPVGDDLDDEQEPKRRHRGARNRGVRVERMRPHTRRERPHDDHVLARIHGGGR